MYRETLEEGVYLPISRDSAIHAVLVDGQIVVRLYGGKGNPSLGIVPKAAASVHMSGWKRRFANRVIKQSGGWHIMAGIDETLNVGMCSTPSGERRIFIAVPPKHADVIASGIGNKTMQAITIAIKDAHWLMAAIEKELIEEGGEIIHCECGRIADEDTGYCEACFGG